MFSKKIVAGAALLALAATAQAQVKVYGLVDMAFGSFEGVHAKGTDDRVTAVQSGAMMTSFIGFAGSEDLGGGLKAEFALESFIGADTGSGGQAGVTANLAGGFWSRASNLALSGSFGKVTIGQYDNPFFTMGLSYNPFGSSMVFAPTMRFYYGSVVGENLGLGFDTGWVNSLTYETPNLSGFTGTIQYAPKENSGSGKDIKDSFTFSGAYTAGPFSIMGAYASAGQNGQGYNDRTKDWGFGTSYDFGVAKAFGQFTTIKSYEAGEAAWKNKNWQLGVSVPVSAQGTVMASYGQAKITEEGVDDSAKWKIFSIAYDHVLSKRTDVYVAFKNESADGVDIELESGSTFAVGIKHAF